MKLDSEEQIDPSLWRPADQPILTPERLAKPDMQIEAPCPECESLPAMQKKQCKNCRGRGRVTVHDKFSVAPKDIKFAQAQAGTLLNHLHRAGVLNNDHLHDGYTYEAWKLLFAHGLGYGWSPIYRLALGDLKATVRDDGLDPADYETLLNRLGKTNHRIVDFTVTTIASPHTRFLIVHRHDVIKATFDYLGEIMGELRDAARKRREESPCASDPIRAY